MIYRFFQIVITLQYYFLPSLLSFSRLYSASFFFFNLISKTYFNHLIWHFNIHILYNIFYKNLIILNNRVRMYYIENMFTSIIYINFMLLRYFRILLNWIQFSCTRIFNVLNNNIITNHKNLIYYRVKNNLKYKERKL